MVGKAVKELLYEAVTYDLKESASNIPYGQLNYEEILKMRDVWYKVVYHSHGLQTIRSLFGRKRG